MCLEWSTGRALATGASEEEIAGVLLAIAPIAGLGRVVAAAPDVATALGYDIAAALEEPDATDNSATVRAGGLLGESAPERELCSPYSRNR
jgi:hypothetical protein